MYSTAEVAKMLGISRKYIEKSIKHGRINPPKKIGMAFAWSDEDVENLRAAKADHKKKREKRNERNANIVKLYNEGLTATEICKALNLTEKQVRSLLYRQREHVIQKGNKSPYEYDVMEFSKLWKIGYPMKIIEKYIGIPNAISLASAHKRNQSKLFPSRELGRTTIPKINIDFDMIKEIASIYNNNRYSMAEVLDILRLHDIPVSLADDLPRWFVKSKDLQSVTWRTTPEVAQELGVSASKLLQLISSGKIDAPPQNRHNSEYLWLEEDFRKAKHGISALER